MASVRDTSPRPPNILFILPSLERAGAEIQTLDVANGLSPDLCRKHLLCFDPGSALRDRVDDSTVTFHSLVRRGRFDYRLAKAIARIIEENEIDVVHCSLFIALFWGWLGITLSGRHPHLSTAIHTTTFRNLRMEVLDRLLYRRLLRRCQRIVFVSQNQRDLWCKKVPYISTIATVIHNGIDTDHFQPLSANCEAFALRASLGLSAGPVLVHVAAFRPEKGHIIMFRALCQVLSQRADVQLLLVGDGALRPVLEQEVKRLGIQSNVRFLGAISDVRPVLMLADLTVLPSTSTETFSLAMLESLAMEVPVVGSDIGGMREAVIDGQTGYLVPPGDVSALARTILIGLEDANRRREMGRQGRQIVVSRYDRNTMIKRTQEVLLTLAEGPEQPISAHG